MECFFDRYRNARVCVALSGGIDSVVLLHALKADADRLGITLSALHVEHGIRGEESVRDLRFCETLCREWNIPLTIFRADVPKLASERGQGIEETARQIRYEAFSAILSRSEADYVATAHHLSDVAETVLFRLARGTALSGMRAIEEGEGIIRPLLKVKREKIVAYARANALPHVEDSTNTDEHYTRNYIRHTLLPAFDRIADGAQEHLVRFASLAAQDDALLQGLAAGKIVHRNGEACVPVDLPDSLFFRACVQCFADMGVEKDYTGAQINEVSRLRTLQSGRKASLPNGVEAVREYGYIVFLRPKTPSESEIPFIAEFGARYAVNELGFSISAEGGEGALSFDLDAFPKGCVVRTRRDGDVILPYRSAKKTLKKFLSDKKIPARLGREIPLIACGNEVLVVVGVEISDTVKVTKETVRRGYIR